MRTEIFDLIVGKTKEILGLNPESTEAEVHESLVNASEDLKADLVVNVANQIANFAADEIQKRADQFAQQLKTDSAEILEQLSAKLELIEKHQSELADQVKAIQVPDVDAKLDQFKAEIGQELNEVKEARGIMIEGDGRVIERLQAGVPKAAPIIKTFGATLKPVN